MRESVMANRESRQKKSVLADLLDRCSEPAASALTSSGPGAAVRCLACAHCCLVRPGRRGVCRVRFNEQGVLRAPWGYVAGLQIDPIEKKPFYHALPGGRALSFGMLGCNLHCAFCQNWFSSQTLRDDASAAMPTVCDPAAIVAEGVRQGADAVISTYNEPLITADWAHAVFSEAKRHGLPCGFVSNGYATPEVLAYLRPVTDLFKVDLKCFDDESYRGLGCRLAPVLDCIQRLVDLGYWVEVVTLLIPGFNDDGAELRGMARFLAGVSPHLPWHVTAFHPQYKMANQRSTTPEDLFRAWQIGRNAGLHHVYAGNLPGRVGTLEDTLCPGCGTILVERTGFQIRRNCIQDGACPNCGTLVAGYWTGQSGANTSLKMFRP